MQRCLHLPWPMAVKGAELLTLAFDAARIERYCLELARHQGRPERRIVALDALLTFISVMATPAEQAKTEYRAIRATLERYAEQARNELLAAQLILLAAALQQSNLAQISALYQSLSRDAFWQLLQRAEPQLTNAARAQLSAWCSNWLAEVRARSAAVCPYPDAIDFAALGIELSAYAAMQDIHHYFSSSGV